jgi:Protein of unknown function (DUF3574)
MWTLAGHSRVGRSRRGRLRSALRRSQLVSVAFAVAVATAGCAASGSMTCRSGEQRLVSETLYLGTATPDGVVDAAEWTRFLQQSVTPRFPEGLTVWQASGQWRGADGKIVEEPSHVLNLVHAGDAASERKVEEIAVEYKSRFRQEAVLRTRTAVCASL